MAIYHLSMQIISRSKGQSAVAAAAYRSGERLIDERTDEEKIYHRTVKPDTMILAPLNSPEWVFDRNSLWNEVEKVEKRKDSQLARELNVALPRELTTEQQKSLVKDFVQNEFVNKGMIADIAIHRDDANNPHAHIMLTLRTIDENGFGKKNRDWNADFANSKENSRGFVKSSDSCVSIREQWSNYANKALEKEGVQERISHLSHKDRGLEQLPTVHLGHVAHDMEKRGVKTDRGNLNRDSQEYNTLVVDLQKYREEKQALEQQKACQEEQKQQAEKFNTSLELVDLQKASKFLKAEPSLQNIKNRFEQLDKWENRLGNNTKYLKWKIEKFEEASDCFYWIHSLEKQIQEAEKRINNINWLNPLKIKGNQAIKEHAEQDISNAKERIQFYHKKLGYFREKLEFSNEEDFGLAKKQFAEEYPGLVEKNKKARQQINLERDVLQKANNALKNAFVRRVASKYPEHTEMAYMSLETAMRIEKLNKANNKIIYPEQMKKDLNSFNQEILRLKKEINRIERNQSRLQAAENYLEKYEKYQEIINKYEKNPYFKRKILISKSAKEEYKTAVSNRDKCLGMMAKEGISGRDDFKNKKDMWNKEKEQLRAFNNQIQLFEKGLSLIEGIFRGMAQANKAMGRDQQRIKGKKKKWKNIHSDLGR